MRAVRALLTAGLLRSAGAVLEAPVFTYDSINYDTTDNAQIGSGAPSISPENARLFFAHRLGLSQYHNLGDADETTVEVLNTHGGAQAPIFGAEDRIPRRMLVIVEGLENTQAIYGDQLSPIFKINDVPSSSSNIQLVLDLLNQDRHRRKASQSCDSGYKNGYLTESIKGGLSTNDPLGTCMVHSVTNSDYRKLDDFAKFALITSTPSTFVERLYGRSSPNSHPIHDVTTIIHISFLENIARKQGTGSKDYAAYLDALKHFLLMLPNAPNYETTVVLMPLLTKHAKRSSNPYGSYLTPAALEKRQGLGTNEQPLATTSTSSSAIPSSTSIPSNATLPKTTISQCFSSEKACNKVTLGCSNHGKCSLKYSEKDGDETTGAECWACACTPTIIQTVDDNTGAKSIKTTYWGGPACQKKDISAPFLLFAGFGILMASVIAVAIGMLYSMGAQELPSVLAAGVAPPPRK